MFISTVRIVSLLDNENRKNEPMIFDLFVKTVLIISISLYLMNLQNLNDSYNRNINQKIVDRIYTGSNYFQSCALLFEISLHPIKPAILWTVFELNRAFLFRFIFVSAAIIIICCNYAVHEINSSAKTVNSDVGNIFN